ncbi:MAG: signal recognition particle protein [Planctomycetaceae bacterium]|jgi:signal recognition particle subunit SRP54|nr:signal recognition particle protein [Planctomycetaceae bacterium]
MFESLTQRLTGAFSFLKGNAELTPENIEEGLRAVRAALLEADVHFKVARDFTERVRERVLGEKTLKGVEASQQFIHACHEELVALLGPETSGLEFAKTGPTVILMAGLQGAGKTTTCAKLAKLQKEKHQRRPLLVAADVKRPAAVEQLKILGQKIGVPVFHVAGVSAPEVCAQGVEFARKNGHDLVILDTAGRLHVDDEMMAEVADVARRTSPHNQLLVVDAMTGQDAVKSAQAFHEKLALTGVVMTKLDGDARGGAALSIQGVVGRPILFAGVGEKIDDLDTFHARRMAGRILGMGDVVGLVETAATKISEEEAQASFEKMVLGDFTLEDMLAQLRMIKRMGPLKKVLAMMPGMSQLGDLDKLVDEKKFTRMEALFTSMTRKERLRPEIIDMSRRRRIARGAGQDPNAVGELLKAHQGMKRMMKEMNRMGLGARLGAKAKEESLRSMSPTGELAAKDTGGGLFGLGGGMGGLGGLGSLFGGAARGGGMPGMGAPGGGLGLPGRPMGSSPTRQSGSKRKKDKRKKRR